jgi:hypothetical protein
MGTNGRPRSTTAQRGWATPRSLCVARLSRGPLPSLMTLFDAASGATNACAGSADGVRDGSTVSKNAVRATLEQHQERAMFSWAYGGLQVEGLAFEMSPMNNITVAIIVVSVAMTMRSPRAADSWGHSSWGVRGSPARRPAPECLSPSSPFSCRRWCWPTVFSSSRGWPRPVRNGAIDEGSFEAGEANTDAGLAIAFAFEMGPHGIPCAWPRS